MALRINWKLVLDHELHSQGKPARSTLPGTEARWSMVYLLFRPDVATYSLETPVLIPVRDHRQQMHVWLD